MNLVPKNIDYRTFVLSAQLHHANGDINCENHARLTADLAQELADGNVFAVLQCEGRYQGADERSIAVIAPREWLDYALWSGQFFGQDSILMINAYGEGILKFMDGRPAEPIGQYLPLDDPRCRASTAERQGDHTHVLGTSHRFTFV